MTSTGPTSFRRHFDAFVSGLSESPGPILGSISPESTMRNNSNGSDWVASASAFDPKSLVVVRRITDAILVRDYHLRRVIAQSRSLPLSGPVRNDDSSFNHDLGKRGRSFMIVSTAKPSTLLLRAQVKISS